jgi:DNA modification methylase
MSKKEIGNAVLYRADCLEVMQQIKTGSVDIILCDLPYGITECKWDSVIPFEQLWEHYKRVIKKNGAIVLTASQPFTTALISSNLRMFKYCWVWEKSRGANFSLTGFQPLKVTEDIVVFSDGACTFTKNGSNMPYYPQKTKLEKPVKRENRGDRIVSGSVGLRKNRLTERTYSHSTPRSLLYASTDKDGRVHPTQKPVALMEYLIRTYTKEGETVLDNCMGSGTTGVACVNTDRNFIGIEKEQKYFDISCERIETAQRQQKLF